MNLSQFLNSVDTCSGTMDNNQLVLFIHDIARVLPESGRDDFLNRMNHCTGFLDHAIEDDQADQRKFAELKDKLEKIESQELCLSGALNEEYDDWYDSAADEFLFADPEGIGRIIERACQFIHEAIDKQMFDHANALEERADALYSMIQNAAVSDISLEMVMQCGEELPEFQAFLPNWIAYLGKENTYIARKRYR